MSNWKHVSEGIRSNGVCYEATVKIGSLRTRVLNGYKTFALDTPLGEMRLWRVDEKARLLREAGAPVTRGTLRADFVSYFATARLTDATRKIRKQQAAWWCDEMQLGERRRPTITSPELQRALNTLHAAGKAASTINKYRTCLSNVFTILDGKNAPNPFKDVPEFRPPDDLPRGVPYTIVALVLKYLRIKWTGGRSSVRYLKQERRAVPSKATARLYVVAYAPITQAQLKLVQPDDLSLDGDAPSILVRGRRKGRGAPPVRKPLLPDAVAAFRVFIEADAFGTFQRGSLRRAWIRARDLAQVELRQTDPLADLSDLKPYDLRHCFGALIYQLTGSDDVAGDMLDHQQKKTTRRYRLAAVPAHLQAANAAAAKLLAGLPVHPTTPSNHFRTGADKTTESLANLSVHPPTK